MLLLKALIEIGANDFTKIKLAIVSNASSFLERVLEKQNMQQIFSLCMNLSFIFLIGSLEN